MHYYKPKRGFFISIGSLLLVTTFIYVFSSYGDVTTKKQENKYEVKDFLLSIEERGNIYHFFSEKRQLEIQELEKIVLSAKEEKNPSLAHRDVFALTARLLGEYRAKEAVDVLVFSITDVFHPYLGIVHPGHVTDAYPCAKALIQIGGKSADGIIEHINKNRELTKKELYLFVYIARQLKFEHHVSMLEMAEKELKKIEAPPIVNKSITERRANNFKQFIELYKKGFSDKKLGEVLYEGVYDEQK